MADPAKQLNHDERIVAARARLMKNVKEIQEACAPLTEGMTEEHIMDLAIQIQREIRRDAGSDDT